MIRKLQFRNQFGTSECDFAQAFDILPGFYEYQV